MNGITMTAAHSTGHNGVLNGAAEQSREIHLVAITSD